MSAPRWFVVVCTWFVLGLVLGGSALWTALGDLVHDVTRTLDENVTAAGWWMLAAVAAVLLSAAVGAIREVRTP